MQKNSLWKKSEYYQLYVGSKIMGFGRTNAGGAGFKVVQSVLEVLGVKKENIE